MAGIGKRDGLGMFMNGTSNNTLAKTKIALIDFFKTSIIFLIATCFALYLRKANVLNDNIYGVYMLAVAVTSSSTSGYFWGIISSVCGVIGVNFFFTYPYFALNFTLAGYPVTFAILLLLSVLTSALTGKVKQAAILSSLRRKRAESLNRMSKELLSANNFDDILRITMEHIYAVSHCSVILYIGAPSAPKHIVDRYVAENDEQILGSMLEKQVAQEAYEQKKNTGLGTQDISQNCLGTYIPFVKKDKTYGVLGLLMKAPAFIGVDTLQYITLISAQTILALDRQEIFLESQKILLEKEKENMRSNLLRAISHDLRTPLTCILGSSATLLENGDTLEKNTRIQLLGDIHHDAEWLIQMVENLLSVTKISGDGTSLKKQDEIVEEITGEAAAKIQKRFPFSKICVHVPDEPLLVPMDAMLIEQVLINLIENAIRHSHSDEPIHLVVRQIDNEVYFSVFDQGIGIHPECLPHLFDDTSKCKSTDSTRGLGIGLPICKSIITAHGGRIFVENNKNCGANFTFVLPMKGEDIYVQQNQNPIS